MRSTAFETDKGGAYWVVLTPSVDDAAWRREIGRAAKEAGLKVLETFGGYDMESHDNAGVVILTDDAHAPMLAGAGPGRVAAITPEPGTSYEALEDRLGIVAPQSVWHASLLLARALDLAPRHTVIAAEDLARRPAKIRLFDRLELIPPQSRAEIPRRPAVHAAFAAYGSPATLNNEPMAWSDRLFGYDPRATSGDSDWGVLDTTGRPRMLVYGPYIALPPGQWRARIRFGVDRAAATHQYRVDWGTRTECVSEYVTPGGAGIYEIDLDFTWETTDAAEVRLILTEGSFMGTVLFQGVSVHKIPATPARGRAYA